MIRNHHCVYCLIKIRKSKNASDGRSVEHMIPQIAVSKKRTNAKGDFNVCRDCNTKKSKIDELFGLISRINTGGAGADEAISMLSKMYNKQHKAVKRMIDSAQSVSGVMGLKLPFSGKDIYDYGVFLTKGEYFKHHGKLFNKKEKVILVRWVSPHATKKISLHYKLMSNRHMASDLARNKNVENIFKECFIVANSKGDEFVFNFNNAYLLITRVVERNMENILLKRKNKRCLIAGFTKSQPSEYCV